MRITEVIMETQALDEIGFKQGVAATGKAAQSAIGGVGKAVGYAAGIPQGIGRAMKKGYRAAVSGIGGDDTASTDTTSASGGASGVSGSSASSGGGFATGGDDTASTDTTSASGGASGVSGSSASSGGGFATGGGASGGSGSPQYDQVISAIRKLDNKNKAKLAGTMQQLLGARAPSSAVIGQMVNQLAAPSGPTSTGGQLSATPGGVRHTASPTNPNVAASATPSPPAAGTTAATANFGQGGYSSQSMSAPSATIPTTPRMPTSSSAPTASSTPAARTTPTTTPSTLPTTGLATVAPASQGASPEVGSTSSTGGDTYATSSGKVHKSTATRDAEQAAARAKIEQDKAARVAAQGRERAASGQRALPAPTASRQLATVRESSVFYSKFLGTDI